MQGRSLLGGCVDSGTVACPVSHGDGRCKAEAYLVVGTVAWPNLYHMEISVERLLLGDSGGVVNSLDFCPASLKSLGCFYFWCVLSSQ